MSVPAVAGPAPLPTIATVREWYGDVPRNTRVPTLAGIAALVVSVIGFGCWASTAMIAGAVVSSGAFVATGQNKIIQHLEGGVIREIAVREGDLVEPGQLLMQLDETGPKAELDRLALRHARSAAIEARLAAEIRDDPELIFPTELVDQRSNPDIASMLDAQKMSFGAWRNNLEADVAALQDGIKALQQRVGGAQTQIGAVEHQIQLIEEELKSKSDLLPNGLIRKPELLALQRAQANLRGDIGRLTGEMGDAKEQIAKTRQQILGIRTAAIKEAVEQLHQVRADLADLRERMRTQQGVLERIKITAPVRGVVVKLRYHTAGGVVEPGKNIMELVPVQAELIIEVRVRPRDIDHVKSGQDASVRVTALNQRTTPMLTGKVVYVSADALPDETVPGSSKDAYVVRVALDAEHLALAHDFTPKAGMPAEVYIKTHERTFFEYLMQPVKDSMSRAFRES
ncbi:MAG: HlyD family type I secretion periplasmic adaptor subunit [Xanthobacteraceae bacterium]